ncbi:adenosylcobinamide-phosphate synthase CbiB [Carboxylicivirga linearis]|uniref:Cobalamin biosynthesis protein CobD n=1 Tax=Carboxylicivirga linearis TaxID=1628157 RepID=A0ABS5JXF4_9BACT|nr:adenosylcobinamide-phosphate synthase CbiB [Carboxylicivirga linearis]MBS2099508.1 cobalamin biosynthesis protein CobD [Carboxylicivirga linearis]
MELFLTIGAIAFAYVLDLIMGDPLWLPHPIVYFGKAISTGEKSLNKGSRQFWKGTLLTLILLMVVIGFFYGLQQLTRLVHPAVYALFVMIFFFFGIANRTLIHEGRMVFQVLDQKGLEAGRKQLSRIVGRDTSGLDEQQIRRAVLETMAENLSDGVVAPIFWFGVAGIPGMMAYKMINTLDSMIGYKNDRYLYFGRFAARLDDVVNFIPARITGLLMTFVAPSYKAFQFMRLFGKKHSSPNAGYPESALAGILNVRFGGPNIYHGQLVDKPYIGENERQLTYHDFVIASRINHLVCLVSVLLTITLQLIINL